MGVVELGKVVQGRGCACVVWAEEEFVLGVSHSSLVERLTDCPGPPVERLS